MKKCFKIFLQFAINKIKVDRIEDLNEDDDDHENYKMKYHINMQGLTHEQEKAYRLFLRENKDYLPEMIYKLKYGTETVRTAFFEALSGAESFRITKVENPNKGILNLSSEGFKPMILHCVVGRGKKGSFVGYDEERDEEEIEKGNSVWKSLQ